MTFKRSNRLTLKFNFHKKFFELFMKKVKVKILCWDNWSMYLQARKLCLLILVIFHMLQFRYISEIEIFIQVFFTFRVYCRFLIWHCWYLEGAGVIFSNNITFFTDRFHLLRLSCTDTRLHGASCLFVKTSSDGSQH